MCTAIKISNKDLYFGRNLDLEYDFEKQVVITPRKYKFNLKNKTEYQTKYAIIGMAQVSDNYPLYAEATNEKGLCIAGLYFPGNAVYNEEKKNYINITTFELIPWILGNFAKVEDIEKDLPKINITNQKFNSKLPVPDLHWMISDKDKSIVIEQVKEGLKIYNNPYEVLTNNPPFSYHEINLSNYLNLTPKVATNRFSKKVKLTGYGQGMGMIGLPGDVTPTARFVRATFNKLNSAECKTEEESVSQFFHILDSVAVVKGTVITKENREDLTIYSSCINASKGIYYFKTYYNNQINAVKFDNKNTNSKKLTIYNLPIKQNIKYLNT